MANLFQRKLSVPIILSIVAVLSVTIVVIMSLIDWLPDAASSIAHEVDWLLYFLLAMATFFVVLIAGLMVFFLFYFQQTDRDRYAPGKTHSTALEVGWTIPPLIIVLFVFWDGFMGFVSMAQPPGGDYPITVTAWQWDWAFEYPNGYVDGKLHVPADRPVTLTLQSNDVIHSLFIPKFRVKKDVVPGRYNKMWFETSWDQDEPTDTLEDWDAPVRKYHLRCTEYCGTGHSRMNTTVVVHKDMADFKKWLAAANVPPDSPVEYGKQTYNKRCSTCHSIDGSARIGPTWKNMYGHQQQIEGQSKPITVNEEYIRESIFYPQAKIAAGFTGQKMSSFKGQLDDREIRAVIEFMKSLSEKESANAKRTWDNTQWGGTSGAGGGLK